MSLPPEPPGAERRAAKRFELHLQVDILEVDGQPVHLSGKTHDISSSGVRLITPFPLQAGAVVVYSIQLSQSADPLRMRCCGSVLRTRPHANPGFHESALTILTHEIGRVSIAPHDLRDDLLPDESAI